MIIAEKALIAAVIASAAALAYLIYGVASHHITAFPKIPNSQQSLSFAAQAALARWVSTAAKVLAWGAFFAVMFALVRYHESSSATLAAGAVGGCLYVGLPALVGAALQMDYRSANLLTDTIVLAAQASGKPVLAVAASWGAVQVFLAATRWPQRARVPGGSRAVTVRPRSLIPACWDLVRCRSAGNVCPRLRERRSCWKAGSGCLCDLSLAEKMAQGAEAWAHEEALAVRQSGARGRARCRTCPIYEEHQERKFRILQWLAYPATVGVMFAARIPLHQAYVRSLQFLHQAVATLKFMPDATNPAMDAGGVQSMVLSTNVEWVFLGCLCLLGISYVLQSVEHVIFKWGW
ncbi:MAG TPA: hypothetical protein VM221_08390 [Armatimonadota bacterium]|nr:hypothetical protein [Armatimonadota bacterium]